MKRTVRFLHQFRFIFKENLWKTFVIDFAEVLPHTHAKNRASSCSSRGLLRCVSLPGSTGFRLHPWIDFVHFNHAFLVQSCTNFVPKTMHSLISQWVDGLLCVFFAWTLVQFCVIFVPKLCIPVLYRFFVPSLTQKWYKNVYNQPRSRGVRRSGGVLLWVFLRVMRHSWYKCYA